MFTNTETIRGNDYQVTAFITPNGQRGLTQISFNAVDGDFRISKTFFIRDIQSKEKTYADFKALVRTSRREYDRAINYVENKGFVLEVPVSE